MKKIAITQANAARIESALASANHHAHDYVYARYDSIAYLANLCEGFMEMNGVTKSERKGAIVGSTSGRDTNKWTAIRTHIEIERGAKEWFLVDCYRVEGYNGKTQYYFSEHQTDLMSKHLLSMFITLRARGE